MFARRSASCVLLLVAGTLLPVACGRSVDLKTAVEVTETRGGWFDAGIVEGKNKVVPSVSFRLKKTTDADVDGVALNVVFRHPAPAGAAEAEDWDEVYVQRAEFSEGHQTPVLTVRPTKGYTGDPPQSRLDILQHSQFRDVRAHVYAKYTASQWVELAVIDVARQLIVK